MIAETVQILTEFICWFIALLKSLLSLKSDLVSQTNLKRLQFGPQKCLKLHVGRKCQTCPELPIDTWKLEKSFEKVTSVMELVDIKGHLGDIVQTYGKNKHNIQERKNWGLGAVNVTCSNWTTGR